MGIDDLRLPTTRGNAEHLYGRVWTDMEELRPWVVLLDRPRRLGGDRPGPGPRLIFRGAGEEWAWPIPRSVHLEDLGDEVLKGYLELARAG